MSDMEKVWETYSHTKDPVLKEKLILKYAPLVKIVAGRLIMHIGQHVEYDDLVSYGIFGLIDAIEKFDYKKGVKFETYASLRIRGSIIDNMRKLDWVPRTLRQKGKQLEQAMEELEAELGREPTEEQLAAKLGLSLEETKDLMKKSSIAPVVSLDDFLEQNHEASFGSVGQAQESPESNYEKQEVEKMLTEAIDKLSDKEKKVITLYYYEELTLKEISAILGVSESRVSQIHSKAVSRLQSKLGRYKYILFS